MIADVTVLVGENGPWASPPGKPMVGRDGVVMKEGCQAVRAPLHTHHRIHLEKKSVTVFPGGRDRGAAGAAHPEALA